MLSCLFHRFWQCQQEQPRQVDSVNVSLNTDQASRKCSFIVTVVVVLV